MAFLYKYSTLNYEKQQRKLCLVIAVLMLQKSNERRGPWDNGGYWSPQIRVAHDADRARWLRLIVVSSWRSGSV